MQPTSVDKLLESFCYEEDVEVGQRLASVGMAIWMYDEAWESEIIEGGKKGWDSAWMEGCWFFFFLFSPLDSRDISSVLTGDRQRFLYCSRIRWEDIPSHNFYFLNKIWRIVINWVLRAGMGAFNKMRKICGDKSIKVTLGNRNLNWYGGISCYLLYAKWNSSDWLCDFFSPSWVLWPNIVIFFADIKVNDLGLDLLHCKYNIPLVQVF